MRLPLEIVRGVRQKCGPEFVIGYTVVADEFLPGGTTYDDSVPFARALEREGVDFIDVGVGTYESLGTSERVPGRTKYCSIRGEWEHTRVFKNEVKIPVIHRAQGDYDPSSWETHLAAGDADIVQLARPLLCDPEIPNKVLQGRLDDIRRCTLCAYCFENISFGNSQIACALNPDTGNPRDYAIQPTLKRKRVLVVGGGPGGLEAARVAALRGHEVTLVEKEAELGGKLRFLSLCSHGEAYQDFCDWEARQCRKAGVRIELNQEATPETIEEAKPDVVILAAGAPTHIVPDIPGISKPHVVTPEDVLTGRVPVGKKVVVIGGNYIGTDIAYTIAEKGLAESVTIIEPQPVPHIGYDMETLNVAILTITLLPKLGVQGFTGTRVEEVRDDVLVVVNPEGKRQKIKADTVVLSMGYIPDRTAYEAISDKVKELYAIGDYVKSRKLWYAVHEAAYIARQI